MSAGKRLSEEEWRQLRYLWESGTGTFVALSGTFGASVSAIKHRSSREGWKRGALAQAIDQKIKENTVDMLARLGMPKEAFMKVVIEGATKTECLKDVSRAYKADDGKNVMVAGKPLVIRQTVTVIDNEHTYKYRQLLAQLAGWYAPPKAAIEPERDDTVKEIPVAEEIKAISQ